MTSTAIELALCNIFIKVRPSPAEQNSEKNSTRPDRTHTTSNSQSQNAERVHVKKHRVLRLSCTSPRGQPRMIEVAGIQEEG